MSVIDESVPRKQPLGRSPLLRLLVGLLLGVALLAITLRLRSEARATRSVEAAISTISIGWVLVAVFAEAVSYVAPALVLARLTAADGIKRRTAGLLTMTALGVGGLLPGQPLPGGAIAYRELRGRGVASRRAAAALTVMIVVVPAASMCLLAAPTLLASALATPLPVGWRATVALAGAMAFALCILAFGVSHGRHLPGSRLVRGLVTRLMAPGRRQAPALLGLGLVAWTTDAACLWATAHALNISLPLRALPIAYITGAVIIAVPVLPGGLGGVEAAMPFVFQAAGASYANAALVVLAWRIVSFWTPTISGLGCWVALVLERRRPTRTRS